MAIEQHKSIDIQNVNHPGHLRPVDAEMYDAMKRALLKALPKLSPGLTVDEMSEALLAHLPEKLFPRGAKAGWWTKAVQLDLEARGIVKRDTSRPFRLRRV